MTEENNLEGRIAAVHQHLSPKHKSLARFTLDNQIFVSFASADQVGKKAGTSAATVVRFAQSLGYDGYSALQTSIREKIPSYLTTVERIEKRFSTPSAKVTTPKQVFQTDIRNIEQTARLLSTDLLETVTREIIKAKSILVMGAGLSASPALFLAHSLRVIGYKVRVSADEGLSLASETASLGEGELLIVISLWRYPRSSINALKFAKENQARTIAISDSSLSPLAEIADLALEVVTEGVAHSLSVTALLSLLNVIIAILAEHEPEKTMKSLQRIDASYKEFNLVITE